MASTRTVKAAPIAAASDSSYALIQENAALKQENAALKTENTKLKAEITSLKKRNAGSDTAAGAPPKKKGKTPAQIKKLFEKWSKALTRESAKKKLNNPAGDLYTVTIKETIPWTVDDFANLFSGGTKIQPLPDNKPTSQITIMSYPNVESVQQLFGNVEIAADGYTVQNIRQRNFSKSYKRGDDPAKLRVLEVHYHKSKQTLQLHFGMEHVDEFAGRFW